tara:strand:+ start:887 stop:1252 length:366 start_codon:yes stop_codon:yes gene_type:complete
MRFGELLKDCIQEFDDMMTDLFHDSDFDLDKYIDDMSYTDTFYEVIDMNIPIYNSDLISVFQSDTDLWYMEDEFGGESILDNIRGVIMMKLNDELIQWWNDECEEKLKQEWKDMKDIFESE